MNNIENKCDRCGRVIGKFGDIKEGKCILHCEKDDWYDKNTNGEKDWYKSEEKIKEFWKIIRQHEEKFSTEVQFSRIIFPDLFREDRLSDNDYKKSFFTDFKESMKKKLVFRNCIFLNSFPFFVSNIEFSDCTFSQSVSFYCGYSYSKSLALKNCSKFNGECEIVNIIQGNVTNEEAANININKCVFNFDVKIENLWIRKCSIDNTSFKQSLNLHECSIEELYINNSSNLNVISIKDSEILKSFNLLNDETGKDNNSINKIVFENNKFCKKSDVSFENVKIYYLSFNKVVNYSVYISFFNTKIIKKLEFININISNMKFHNFNFEKAQIFIKNVAFISNTGFTIFNDVKWPKYNDFVKESTQNEDGKDYVVKSNRDIFRQLKIVNEKQGNYIEANKFYSAEMEEYRNELICKDSTASARDKFIFGISYLISDFSRNWILPIVWYVIFGFTFSFIYYTNFSSINNFSIPSISFFLLSIVLFFIEFFKYKNFRKSIILLPIVSCINYFCNIRNEAFIKLFDFINPFNTSGFDDIDGRLFWWILFRIISVFIIYQFIISLRRQTRR